MNTTVYVHRKSTAGFATLGELRVIHDNAGLLCKCFTLEDLPQKGVKIPGRTRIPAGEYPLKLWADGEYHRRYSTRFPDIHKGSLVLQNVPGFTGVLLHCGNSHFDTRGCILVGLKHIVVDESHYLQNSSDAWRKIYLDIAEPLMRGENVSIKVYDEPTA